MQRTLLDISGRVIEQLGEQNPVVQLGSGRKAVIQGTCTETKKSAMSVGASCDNGNTLVFSSGKSFITRKQFESPPYAEMMVRRGVVLLTGKVDGGLKAEHFRVVS